MADIKISALPTASTPLTTDIVPIVSSSTTSIITLKTLVGTVNTGAVAGTSPILIGAATSANSTRFPNALSIISNTAAGIQKNESHNIGLVAEGTANSSNTAIYGIGVYGVGYTASATRCSGVVGEGHVSATGDTGYAIGIRGYANDTHAGGSNIGLYGEATNGATNYALYMNAGDIYSTVAQTWTFGTGGITLAGTLTVNGALSATSNAVGSVTAATGGLTSVTAVTGSLTLATGGVTLATQAMAAGSVWRVRAYGTYNNASSSANIRQFTMACYWGSTALTAITTGNVSTTGGTSYLTNWEVEFVITGSSTTAAWVTGRLFSGVTAINTASPLLNNATAASVSGLTTTSTLDFRVGQTGTATSTDTINVQSVTMERIK